MDSVWVDGALMPANEPVISAFDHGLLTGDGVFETLRVREGRAFAIRLHLERLARSAAAMGLRPPDAAALRMAMDEVIAANALASGRLRITVTGGPAPLGSDRGVGRCTTIVAAGPQAPWPPTTDVTVVPWPRNEKGALAGVKTTSYGENVVALAYARARGASEAIFANTAGDLCEGTGSNVFVAVGGRLLTPPLSAGCLDGVTRRLVVGATGAVEENLLIAALGEAEEAFLTSTTRDIQPIRAVDGAPLACCPGPLTAAAQAAFADLAARSDDP
jgi:branched-subunit amino acid aminotransferase/4-amino-4-deoxychorismate lyase